MFSSIGGPEIVVILLVVIVLFGWKKLPDAARSLGRSMRIFKAEVDELKREPSAASQDTVEGSVAQPTQPAQPDSSADAATTGQATGNHDNRS